MKFNSYIKFVSAVVLIIFIISTVFIIEPIAKEEKTLVSYAVKRDLVQSVMVSGIVEAKDKKEITVDAGQMIKKLYIEKDSIVNNGDILFQLDGSNLTKDIKSKEIELKKAEVELENVSSMTLEKDNAQSLLSLKEAELDIERQRADLAEMKEDLDMSRAMYEKGHLSKKDMDDKENKFKKSLAELELLEKRYELDKSKNDEFIESYEKNKKYKEEILSKTIEILKFQLDELKESAKETNTAPINGKVVYLDLEEGEKVDTKGPHIMIYDLSELYIDILLNQRYASSVKPGDIAEIKIQGIEDKKLYGSVYSIDDIAGVDAASGRKPGLRVKIKFNKPDPMVKAGYIADVKLIFNSKSAAVAVDYRAIVKDRYNNEFVYVLKDGIAERTYVETGITTDFEVEITKGIISEDQYIVNPSESMREKSSFRLWRYDVR